MNRLLFAGKARVHLKELAITEVTDSRLKMGSFTNIIQRFGSFFKNTCLQELNNLRTRTWSLSKINGNLGYKPTLLKELKELKLRTLRLHQNSFVLL